MKGSLWDVHHSRRFWQRIPVTWRNAVDLSVIGQASATFVFLSQNSTARQH